MQLAILNSGRRLAAVSLAGAILCATLTAGEPARLSPARAGQAGPHFYSDDPLWTMPKPQPVTAAAARKLSDYYDFFENTLFAPGERAPRHGRFLPSQAVNSVDESPDSAWYTNRHAKRPMSLDELRAGPGDSRPPAAGAWTVIAAKNEGVTPGFRIRDAAGRQYLLKFDPPQNPEMASAADVITSKFLYALGYNVPENYIVYFDRGRLTIGGGAMLKDEAGRRRPIRENDVRQMLAKTPRTSDGRYRAVASLILEGKPLGPFRYHGTRSDDPNDLVPHEHRRDLRGLRTFCAWLGHDDSKALNTLDVLVNEDGIPVILHYLIDFGASLGSASFMANSPRDGNVTLFSWRDSAAQFFSLGLYAPRWQRAVYPNIPAAGRFEYEIFDPLRWVPDYPNAAFANENPADREWAARKVAAFSDEEIRAIVDTGRYTDPAAAEWVVRCLIERRNKIVRSIVRGTAALDRFEASPDRLRLEVVAPGPVDPARLRVQWFEFDNATGNRERIEGANTWNLPAARTGYLAADIRAGDGPALRVYVSLGKSRPRVIGVERQFSEPNDKD